MFRRKVNPKTMQIDYRAQFERQRRNLIGGCVLLLILYVGDVGLNRFVVFGAQVEFEQPHFILWILHAAVAYWLWRYYQFWARLENAKIQSVLTERVKATLKRWAFRDSYRLHERELHEVVESTPEWKPTIGLAKDLEVEPLPRLRYQVKGEFSLAKRNFETNEYRRIRDVTEEFMYSGPLVWLVHSRAWIATAFSSYLFSEYYFPLLFPFVLIVFALI